jgi:adenylate cyclase
MWALRLKHFLRSYDVWGDTVNLASRLEGQSRPSRVLVSHATKTRLERSFALELCAPLEIEGYGLVEARYVVGALEPHSPAPSHRSCAGRGSG